MVFPQTGPAPKGRTGGTLVQPRKKSTAIFGERGNGQALVPMVRFSWQRKMRHPLKGGLLHGSEPLDLARRGVFALGVLTLGILLRLAWNLFVFCDEYNFSPEAVCGSGLDLGLLWLRLLAALLLLLGGLGLLFRLPLVRVVMVLSVVNLGISLRLLGTLLLFCHRQAWPRPWCAAVPCTGGCYGFS